MTPFRQLPLYWRVCVINGLVFILAAVALALSPSPVSRRAITYSEVGVLAVGVAVILVLNALLLRTSLAPSTS